MAATPRRRSSRHRPGGPYITALLAADARLSAALFRVGGAVPRPLWLLLELGGNGLVWLAAALIAILLPATSPAARSTWCNLLVAWAVDLLLVGALKSAVRRPRPAYNLRSDFTVVVPVDAHSFPSGHSSRCGDGKMLWRAIRQVFRRHRPPPSPQASDCALRTAGFPLWPSTPPSCWGAATRGCASPWAAGRWPPHLAGLPWGASMSAAVSSCCGWQPNCSCTV